MKKYGVLFATAIGLALSAGTALAESTIKMVEVITSPPRTEFIKKQIAEFEAANPGIKVVFSPTAPTEYNAALNAKLDGGSAGDIITCRPFDASLELFNKGHLAPLNDLAGMEGFSPVAKAAWSISRTPSCS